MKIRSRIMPLVAVAATALIAGPVFAVAHDESPRTVYREAEDLLPALEGFESNFPGNKNPALAPGTEPTEPQAVASREEVDDVFSGNAGVLYENVTDGNRFTLRLKVPGDGTYGVAVRFGTGPDLGIVQPSIDGRPLGDPVDLYAAEPGRTPELTLGRLELAEGDHTITFTVAGRAAASTGLRARVDYIELRP